MRIKKTSQYIEGGASLSNVYGNSQSNGYSQEYINGLGTYSTDEVRIGTWIDGKPLYRKVVQITMPSDVYYAEINLNISNVDTIMLNNNSFIINATYRIPLNSSNANVAYTCWASVLTSGKIAISNSGTSIQGKTAYVIVEYTKTTDTAQNTRSISSNDEVVEPIEDER